MKEKIQDLISATKGVMGEVLAEDAVPMLAEEMLKGTVLEVASEAVSVISPRIGGVMVAYQQRRWERNWEKYISTICEKQDALNERLEKLDDEMKQKFREIYFPLISDFVPNEKQIQKINLIVNGMESVIEEFPEENVTLLYYEMLEQLSILEIRVLRLAVTGGVKDDSSMNVMSDYGIRSEELSLVVQKLYRTGLLEDKALDKVYQNLERIKEAIENPKNSHIELSKKDDLDTHQQSTFGQKFIKFFKINSEIAKLKYTG